MPEITSSTLTRVLTVLAALVGVGLVLAAGAVLFQGAESSPRSADGSVSANGIQRTVDGAGEDPAVRVREPLLVVNRDGSAAVGAYVENGKDSDVALMGVSVWVDRQPVRVNATQMWLPVPAGERSQVGAASDAGGFVMPAGIEEATQADMAFRFDDGTCVSARVTAVARTSEHRLIYPKSNRTIGPVTADDLQTTSTPCTTEQPGR